MSPSLTAGFHLPLPHEYDVSDALSFNGRDSHEVAERVSKRGIQKALLLDNIPVVIDIKFNGEFNGARCSVFTDGALTPRILDQAYETCLSILGLRIESRGFFDLTQGDALFTPLIEKKKGLRIIQSASIFEALTWAIIGQQINVPFAISLRRTFVQKAGRRHSSGLWCYPVPEDAAKIDRNVLTSNQFSSTKAETLLRVANLIARGNLNLLVSENNTINQISDTLLKIKGIGPWTVNYTLLRGYAYADCSLHGDVAIRTAISKLVGISPRPSIAEAEVFLRRYSPHRTMAAAYLWSSLVS
jgi:DNA-3-methyladenine glycosylase II